jgi:hypothetical protein
MRCILRKVTHINGYCIAANIDRIDMSSDNHPQGRHFRVVSEMGVVIGDILEKERRKNSLIDNPRYVVFLVQGGRTARSRINTARDDEEELTVSMDNAHSPSSPSLGGL